MFDGIIERREGFDSNHGRTKKKENHLCIEYGENRTWCCVLGKNKGQVKL